MTPERRRKRGKKGDTKGKKNRENYKGNSSLKSRGKDRGEEIEKGNLRREKKSLKREKKRTMISSHEKEEQSKKRG